jgi:pullulanase/glycogen debranching enzyme
MALGSLLALVPLTGAARPAPPPTLADCDADTHARVLLPAPASGLPASAHWLDATRLQWPGREATGRFRLYHSRGGHITATPGQPVRGADGAFALRPVTAALPAALAQRFAFVAAGARLELVDADRARLATLHAGQLVLVQEDAGGRTVAATRLQVAGALDDLYSAAEAIDDLGATPRDAGTRFRLWAPTAQRVSACLHADGRSPAQALLPFTREDTTGAWTYSHPADVRGQYYTYLVDVFVPGTGLVRNRVTDPYSISLTADSTRSYIADLDDAALKPAGWDATPRPAPLAAQTDMVIYELHVRDFSRDDASVAASHRGKYLAFTESGSHGMRHLRELAAAGLTDVHLLPVFDLATVPERGCSTPLVPHAPADSEAQQRTVMAEAARDCFNWGYDPYHFNAPEGSYASDADDGAVRIREFRAMVQALHGLGLRVGMDVVYNHTTKSGQHPQSVLDRIVPGYYHRLDANGTVERSTCCDNTATEHRMMAKLMVDSAALWVRHYRIDSFRFDLMGHQPRAAMEALQARVDGIAGRHVQLIGEGWNFGEVADGVRFVQAAQGALNGSGIGTFSDRARDAIRGGGPADKGEALFTQGYVNGLHYAPNAVARSGGTDTDSLAALLHSADLVRAGLAGTLHDYVLTDRTGAARPLSALDYKGQPAGYASQPGEVVNYVENHDNQTLYDINVFKLPRDTPSAERARVQVLALALNAFSQGVAYFHAGGELLRSKSLDRNSFDSGDWFNRLDWRGQEHHFGAGLPPGDDNAADWALMRPLLADAALRPTAADIAFTRAAFRDLLRLRASTPLFRLRTADEVRGRLSFPNTGPTQNPVVIAGHLDGRGYPDAQFVELLYLVNVSPTAQTLTLPEARDKGYRLHPVHRDPGAGDPRPAREARYRARDGRFTVPARTAVVFVVKP